MNIYVSNLSYATTKDSLEELFETYGIITSVKIAFDRATRRPRGFGFVEMADDAAGQLAIDNLNQTNFEGNIINLSIAQPKPEPDPRDNRGSGGYGNRGGNSGGYNNRRY